MSDGPREAIVGAWRLIHSVEYGPDGTRHYPFGDDAVRCIFAASTAILRGMMPGVEQGFFKPPSFETVTLDRAAQAYQHINDGTARNKQVIAFPSWKHTSDRTFSV